MNRNGVGLAGELRSVVSSLRAESLGSLPDARVEQDFRELHEAVEALETERLRRLAEIDRRRLFERDGHLSSAAWLAGRFCIGWAQARRSLQLARGLDAMDLVRIAFERGQLSLGAARVLTEAHEAEPVAFESAQGMLVEAAARHSIADLRRTMLHWRHLVASERAGDSGAGEVLRARRRPHASVTLDGMIRLDGDLDPETGEMFMTALSSALDADARSHGAEAPRAPPASRTSAPLRNAVPTRSRRSAGAGLIDPTGRWWPGSVHT